MLISNGARFQQVLADMLAQVEQGAAIAFFVIVIKAYADLHLGNASAVVLGVVYVGNKDIDERGVFFFLWRIACITFYRCNSPVFLSSVLCEYRADSPLNRSASFLPPNFIKTITYFMLKAFIKCFVCQVC